jgi:uncharacterized protein (DUF1800 family)
VATTIYPSMKEALAAAAHTVRSPLSWDPVDHLLSRFAFGPTAAARAAVTRSGVTAWYNDQVALAAKSPGYGGNLAVAAEGPMLALSPAEVRQSLKASGDEFGWTAMNQLTRVTLGLQVWSDAQLYETLVDFFANHLNVTNHSGDLWNTRHLYDRTVIRAHAMGSFTNMLLASAKDPAMLLYLNLATSVKNSVNENYGRELLELHTVGMVYSEADVKNASYLLTGRTIDIQTFGYSYNPANHKTGAVKVLGFSHANSSTADGKAGADAMVAYLARHPETARRLAQKLCVRFVSDSPSSTLVAAVAKAYLDSGTQILPMVSTILRSDEFWSARGNKTRRPAENLIATLRVLGTQPAVMGKALEALHWMSAAVGHVPLDWVDPDGYPDVATAWRGSGTLLKQWQLNLGMAGDWWSQFAKSDKTLLYGGTPTNSGDAIARLGVRLTGTPLPAAHLTALQTFLGEPATTPMAGSTLKWLISPLIALILDGPRHAFR